MNTGTILNRLRVEKKLVIDKFVSSLSKYDII